MDSVITDMEELPLVSPAMFEKHSVQFAADIFRYTSMVKGIFNAFGSYRNYSEAPGIDWYKQSIMWLINGYLNPLASAIEEFLPSDEDSTSDFSQGRFIVAGNTNQNALQVHDTGRVSHMPKSAQL